MNKLFIKVKKKERMRQRARQQAKIIYSIPVTILILCIVRIIVFANIYTKYPFVQGYQQNVGIEETFTKNNAFVNTKMTKEERAQSYSYGASGGPCHNFYASVCNIFDPSEKRSIVKMGTFAELVKRSQLYTKEVLNQMSTYNTCVEVLSTLNHVSFDSYVNFLWENAGNVNLVSILKNDLPFPFKLEIVKQLSNPDYAMEIDINFGFYFHLKFPEITDRISQCSGMNPNIKHGLLSKYSTLNENNYPSDLPTFGKCVYILEDFEETHPLLFDLLSFGFNLEPNTTLQTNCQQDYYENVLQVFQNDNNFPTRISKQDYDNKFFKCLYRYHLIEILGPFSEIDPTTNIIELVTDDIATLLNNLKRTKQTFLNVMDNDKKEKMMDFSDENGPIAMKCEELVKMVEPSKFNSFFAKKLLEEKEVISYQQHSEKVYELIILIKNGVRDLLENSNSLDKDGKDKALSKIDQLVIRNMAEEFVDINLTLIDDSFYSKQQWILNLFNSTLNRAKIKTTWPKESYLKARLNPKYWMNEGPYVPADVVNAWYDPSKNTITLPLAITLFPLFRGAKSFDLAFLGVIIGHELGHMTDVHGIHFDQYGNFIEDGLWKINSSSLYQLSSDYGTPCGRIDYGENTLGEDMADQMGVRVLYNIYRKATLEKWTRESPERDEYLGREFFSNYARLWCGRSTYKRQCHLVANDVHALAKHRVNKTLRQISQFSDMFMCRYGDKMYREERTLIY